MDIVQETMYDTDDFISDIQIFFDPAKGEPILGKGVDWKPLKNQLMKPFIHRNYGFCLNLDFSFLSESNGKFRMAVGSHILHIRLRVQLSSFLGDLNTVLFLHNGTDVEDIGESVMPISLQESASHVIITLKIFLLSYD